MILIGYINQDLKIITGFNNLKVYGDFEKSSYRDMVETKDW